MTIDYGFQSTEEIEYDAKGLPVGTNKFMATSEEMDKNNHLVVTYECVEGSNKGKSGKVWYCVNHGDAQVANIAKQALKRLSDATGKPISQTQPIKGRVMTLEVRKQKKNPEFTEIARYLPADHKPEIAAPF